jgi:serine/threonine protein phosphatase PrpC
MEERIGNLDDVCPNCGNSGNEAGSSFCQTCGVRLGSSLTPPPPPPNLCEAGRVIAGRFRIESLLWTAPTYNAYSAGATGSPETLYTIIEQLAQDDPLAELSPLGAAGAGELADDSLKVSGSLEEAAAAFERFGIFKPIEHTVEGENLYIVFEQIQGQALAHLDQTGEKDARQIGLLLCDLAERFHRHGWVYNGFEPYGIVLDPENRPRLIGFNRARQEGSPVDDAPIYPSRGFTAPELFDEGAVYDLARALTEDPDDRIQTVIELRDALVSLNLPVVLQSGHFTDVGLVRELNEDSVLALNLTQYYESVQTQIGLYIVSDGMGGEAAGEVASRVTVRAVAEWVTEKLISASLKSTQEERIAAPTHTGGLRLAIADGNEMATTEMLRMAVIHANREVMAYSRANPESRGLGATVTVAMIVGEVLTISHVGDSRCYLLSGDRFEQITEDHSLVQRMVNTGNLSRSEARIHPYRNVIYRSIGADEQIEIDIIRRKLKSGDVILLCSDGLNSMLGDDQIRDILMVNPDPNAAAKELVVAANAAGGEDNTSVIVVRIS